MKQRVDLYLLTADNFNGCFPFVCQLIEKAYQQGHAPTVHTESAAANEALDNLLWTFRNTSFIPHQPIGSCTLSVNKACNAAKPSLIVSCRLVENPTPVLESQRLLQIVPHQPSLLQLARQHYRFYQQQGYQMTTHQIK